MTYQIFQTQILLEKPREKRVGRPEALTKEQLLQAIRLYGTVSPTELSKRLNVSRQTVYRKLKLIPKEIIDGILREIAENELKPYQMTYEGFLKIPEIEKFKKILERRQISKYYKNHIIRRLWRLCIYLNRHPRNLTIEECADFLLILKQKKVKNLNYHFTKQAIRSWFQNFHGINGEILTSKGIDGSLSYELGKRAHDRLNQKQRHAFIKALKEIIENDSNEKPFIEVWLSLPYFLYYTATRIKASLNAYIENIEKLEDRWIITVIDKGKHKNGRKKWRKIIIGELKEKLEKNLKSRENPKQGKLFPLSYKKVRKIFIKAYKKANIPTPKQPCHIWRHTSAQDFLEATDWNYELCAQLLGWEDPRILRKCYGAMSEKAKEKALKKAMGLPLKETKKEFKF